MSIKKQSAVLSAGSIALMGFQWLCSVILVRLSGYKDAGVFALAMSVSNVVSTFANYGLRSLFITDYNQRYSGQQYIFARAISCLGAFTFCTLYLIFLVQYSTQERLAIILYLLYNLANVMSDILMAGVQLKGHLEINGYSISLRGLFGFLAFLLVFLRQRSITQALGMMAVASIGTLIVYDIPQYRKYCEKRWTLSAAQSKKSLGLFRDGFPVMLALVVPVTITAVPRLAIKNILSTEMLGYFASVFTPSVLLSTMIPPILTAGVPTITQYWNEKRFRDLIRIILLYYGIVFIFVLFSLLGAAAFGRPVLKLIFGDEILQYSSLLFSAIGAIGLSCLCICGNNIIITLGEKKYLLLFSGTALILTAVGASALVKKSGIYGAAYIQMIAYGLQAILQIVFIVCHIQKARKAVE